VVPVIKVLQLSFRKLVQTLLNQKPSKTFTEMNSIQLDTLNDAAKSIHGNLFFIFWILEEADNHQYYRKVELLDESIKKINNYLDSTLLLIFLYIIHVVPHLNDPSSHHHFQTWSASWQHLFLTATHNFLSAADKFENPQSSGF
jgi:hypothetical protein